jgi:hypothetical protein
MMQPGSGASHSEVRSRCAACRVFPAALEVVGNGLRTGRDKEDEAGDERGQGLDGIHAIPSAEAARLSQP